MQTFACLGNSSALKTEDDSSRSLVKMEPAKDRFPAGLRVLVVDDDPMWLKILEKMLQRCLYEVTTCIAATSALDMLRQNKNHFDLVISDVYMPDMDGFKLLELVGLEMDLPVIMMSSDGEFNLVKKGVTNGACDYLLKPVRIEELKNIWQHVYRKRTKGVKESENYAGNEDNDRSKRIAESTEQSCALTSRKRKDVKEEEDDNENETDDPSALKKPRVVWSVPLHQQFVSAVNQLGIDKAVPKRILELMGVQGLTRENVASHLQKYRLLLKRLNVNPHCNAVNLPFTGVQESSIIRSASSLDEMHDLHSLATSGQLSAQALTSLNSGIINKLSNIKGLGGDGSIWIQSPALQACNYGSMSHRPQAPWLNSQNNIVQALSGGVDTDHLVPTQQASNRLQQLPSVEDLSGTSSPQNQFSLSRRGGMRTLSATGESGFDFIGDAAMMIHALQQQQQRRQRQQQLQLQEFCQNENVVLGSNSSGSTFAGQNLLPVEPISDVAEPKAVGMTSGNSHAGKLELSSTHDVCVGGRGPSVSHEIDRFVMTSNVDSQKHSLLGVAGDDLHQALSVAGVNTQAGPDLTPTVMELGTHLANVDDSLSSAVMQGMRPNLGALGNFSSVVAPTGLRQSSTPAWQNRNEIAVQDFVRGPTHSGGNFSGQIPNPNLHERSVFGQSQESNLYRPSRNIYSKREPATTESTTSKQKEAWALDSVCANLESAGSMFGDMSSDDLMAVYLKQQQGMMSFTDTGSPLDGFTPEICF